MNVDFINPFVATIDDILVTMASTSCEYQKPYVKDNCLPLGVLTGLIPMRGDNVSGSLAISFSEGAILHISSAMLGETLTKVDSSCQDLTGELTNMLSGGARKRLWEKGFDFEMSQPTLITGEEPVNHLIEAPVIVIPFITKAGPFHIEVALANGLARARQVITG